MGTLLKFRKRSRPSRVSSRPPVEAEIILFTGVRYERGRKGNPRPTTGAPKRRRG